MIDLFIRWARRQFLDLTPAGCMCCRYMDHHTERAWIMWVDMYRFMESTLKDNKNA